MYRAISQEAPEEIARKIARYREEGYRRFQLKVGGDPNEDIERIHALGYFGADRYAGADANTGWLMHEAARVVEPCAMWMYIEQPCAKYEENLAIRRPGYPL